LNLLWARQTAGSGRVDGYWLMRGTGKMEGKSGKNQVSADPARFCFARLFSLRAEDNESLEWVRARATQPTAGFFDSWPGEKTATGARDLGMASRIVSAVFVAVALGLGDRDWAAVATRGSTTITCLQAGFNLVEARKWIKTGCVGQGGAKDRAFLAETE
jgi:hypothetical protein